MDLGLEGRKAFVSGGTKGIGRAIVEQFLAEGATVAFFARSADGVKQLVEDYKHTGRLHGETVDALDTDAVRGWTARAAALMDGLDIIVGNVTGSGGAASVSEEAFQSHLRIDVLSFTAMVDSALPHLTDSDSPSIVSIASTAAVENFGAGACAFNSIKAALINLTAGYSQSLASHGIRANVVSPGPTFVDGGAWDRVRSQRPEFYADTMARIPLGRFAAPEDVARAVVFLASPAAALITGENLVIDGGLTRRVAY